jgi:cobalt/nickel transport system permease protein
MSDDVYKAMLSRGFHGEFRTIDRFRSRPVDYLWLVTVLVISYILILFERDLLR